MQSPFAPKQTFARIEFLRQGGQLVDKNGTFNVKILAEKWTKGGLVRGQVDELTNKQALGLVS